MSSEEGGRAVAGLTQDERDKVREADDTEGWEWHVLYGAVERIIAARVAEHEAREARVGALHRRRPHSANGGKADFGAFDFVGHGQTEFPDQCNGCRVNWPCATARALDGGE